MFGPMGAQNPCHYSSCDVFVHITGSTVPTVLYNVFYAQKCTKMVLFFLGRNPA